MSAWWGRFASRQTKRITSLENENRRLRDAVITARRQFEHYGQLHQAKPDLAKAKVNFDLADYMDAALYGTDAL